MAGVGVHNPFKMSKITKEELIKRVAVLESQQASQIAEDQRLREEFGKTFGWVKKAGRYDDNLVVVTPSWEKIFVEVGRLMEKKDVLNLASKVESNAHDIKSMSWAIKNIQHDQKDNQAGFDGVA